MAPIRFLLTIVLCLSLSWLGAAKAVPIPPEVIEPGVELAKWLLEKGYKAVQDRDTYRRESDNYWLYEGNFCSEQMAGSFWPRRGLVGSYVNAKKVSFIQNDEARSIFIRGPVNRGEVIWVCDHPSNCYKDDYSRIELLADIPADKGYCVGSFERSYTDPVVRVAYTRKNGLDGKVSSVYNYD